jgi:hypothetical protein
LISAANRNLETGGTQQLLVLLLLVLLRWRRSGASFVGRKGNDAFPDMWPPPAVAPQILAHSPSNRPLLSNHGWLQDSLRRSAVAAGGGLPHR